MVDVCVLLILSPICLAIGYWLGYAQCMWKWREGWYRMNDCKFEKWISPKTPREAGRWEEGA